MVDGVPQVEPLRDEPSVMAFVDRFSGVLTSAGIPRRAARVFVLLLTTDSGRLTAADIGQQLKSSAGAVVGAGTRAGRRLGETSLFFAFMAEETPELIGRRLTHRDQSLTSETPPLQGKKRQ